ncbi:MAG: hypothetical protein MJ208_03590 [Bacilli bacterium]|nr:hypothetical protein [Bacilli bacterium]
MVVDYFIYCLISLLAGVASFYLTDNLYFLIFTFLIYLLSFIAFEVILKRKARIHREHHKDLTIFIHDLFLPYSANVSLEESIAYANKNVSMRLQEEIKLLDEFKGEEKLDRLTNYFHSSLYSLFLKTIHLCETSSGEKIQTISFLLEENNRYIFQNKTFQKNAWRSLCEFALLWIVSFLILIIIRFAINSYFSAIVQAWFYLFGIGIYFFFFLLSVHLFMYVTYQGEKNNEQ